MPGRAPLVSILTANFNGGHGLMEAVASAQAQTLADFEMIVVDDASSDGSPDLIEALAAHDPRLRLIRQARNAGPGAARNRALETARGRWLAILDSDDRMQPDRLERLTAHAEAVGADIIADNLRLFGEGARPETLLGGTRWASARWIGLAEFIASSRMYARQPGPGYLKPLIRAEALRASGVRYREDLRIGEDYDLVLRLLACGLRMRFEPEPLYLYRRHAGSISHRLGPAHLEAMLEADADFEARFGPLTPSERRAQALRRRSLRAALAYEQAIGRLKAGDLAGALFAAAPTPAAWPLLTLPIQARARRLARRLTGSSGALSLG